MPGRPREAGARAILPGIIMPETVMPKASMPKGSMTGADMPKATRSGAGRHSVPPQARRAGGQASLGPRRCRVHARLVPPLCDAYQFRTGEAAGWEGGQRRHGGAKVPTGGGAVTQPLPSRPFAWP
jgi:hypothetical protein